jgi:peptide/nickel transport system substrate-binding protein
MIKHQVRLLAAIVLAMVFSADMALAQKQGGILQVYHRDTPASGSIHEEATNSVNMPFMSVFGYLAIYDQSKPQNSLDTIIPDLATGWAWNDDKTKLTFKLRPGVKWHDGKLFTAQDVKCTWELLQAEEGKGLRKNPRASWYHNLRQVTVNGELEATFHLGRPQPAFIALLASGYTPVYPCHVSARDMRTKPVGTGPFKFVEFKQNEYIKLARNPDYWDKGLPYLDGIEFTIISNRSTRVLGFIAGKFDLTFTTDISMPLLKDVKTQAPHAVCETRGTNVHTNLIVNREKPPFDNAKIRQAMMLTLDRKAFVDILGEGHYAVGGAMLPPPDGVWGMAPEFLQTVAGYGSDVKANRDAARKLMREQGYGPDKPLKIKVSTRNIEVYRDPAVILIDHLKEIHIEGELEVVETSLWHAKVARKDYTVGLNLTGVGVDDPDVNFYENYACKSERNYTQYCNPDIEKQFDAQSMESDPAKRKQLVWEIDKKLQEDGARPVIYHGRGSTCWQPYVKGLTTMSNSSYNGFRYERVWLDK